MDRVDLADQKIMVVDDDSQYVRLLERILQINSYHNIYSITDSRKVIDSYKQSKPNLLLIDIEMPYLNGFEIIKMLKEEVEDDILPVIVISAHNDWDHKKRAMELGAQDFIGKPFSQSDILRSIQNFFKTHQANIQRSTTN